MYLNDINNKELPSQPLIYRIVNTITNKSYIGLTKGLGKRIREHKKCSSGKFRTHCYIHRAIKKYGPENFRLEILELCEGNMLCEREEFYISEYQSNNPLHGYNMTSGGEKSEHNEDSIAKRRISALPRSVKVASYDLSGNLLKTFVSIKECSRYYGISDSDIIRCDKRNWTRLRLRFRRYEVEPLQNVGLYIDTRAEKIGKSRLGKEAPNRLKCRAIDKQSGDVVEANSLKSLALKLNLHTSTLHKIFKNNRHKKWLILKEVSLED